MKKNTKTSENSKNEFTEIEDQRENEDDLGEISESGIRQVALSGSDWTVETILNQINKENISLNPNFQRREAWDNKRKSKFIESVILGYPIPQIVLAENKEKRGRYIVLDGKQRLLSLRQFAADANDAYTPLKLIGLKTRNDLNGSNLASLKEEIKYAADLRSFENQTIRTIVIKNWPDETFLYSVFLRLNTGSVILSPQELRQALHPGKFVSFVEEKSGNSKALKEILKSDKPDFRMRDAELLVRYYAFSLYIESYKGNLKEFLDTTCKPLPIVKTKKPFL